MSLQLGLYMHVKTCYRRRMYKQLDVCLWIMSMQVLAGSEMTAFIAVTAIWPVHAHPDAVDSVQNTRRTELLW